MFLRRFQTTDKAFKIYEYFDEFYKQAAAFCSARNHSQNNKEGHNIAKKWRS
jgi:hypothetical protein